MRLLLIRHGMAQDHGHPQGDGARALVDKGWQQARAVGRFLQSHDLCPELVLTSPLVRAVETARGVCESAGMEEALVQPWLACGMYPDRALEELAGFAEFDSVALVGHQPDFSAFAEALLGSTVGGIEVKKASVLMFDGVEPPRMRGYLRLLLPPKFL